MLIREYTESDLDALRAIHAAQRFDYALPDLRNPLFLTKLVLCSDSLAPVAQDESARCSGQQPDSPAAFPHRTSREPPREIFSGPGLRNAVREGNSRILGAALLRITAEAYLLLDRRAGTPRERWQWLLALHEAARRDAWLRGFEDVHAWLPPPIAKKFGRRLERLGWRRDDAWTPYCLRFGC